MRAFLPLLAALFATMVSGFQPLIRPATPVRQETTTAIYGLFDKFINDMEAGYKGEDSAYQKQKAFDAEKRQAKKDQNNARKAKGYTELKDVGGKRTFAKTKYDAPEEKPKEKKLFGLF